MATLDYPTSIERDGRLLAAAVVGNYGAPVAACPGWNVADLLWHIREVQWFWARIVAGLLTEPPEDAPPRPDDPTQLLADYTDGLAHLVELLRKADPQAPCWTWASQKDCAFVIRHQAQEVAVHRWDAEAAGGRETAIDAAIAADAVDEFLTFSTGWVIEGTLPLPGPVRLEATDTPGAWTVAEDESRTLRRSTADPVSVVRGTASDLLLGLYRRAAPDRLSIDGDPTGWPALVGRNNLD